MLKFDIKWTDMLLASELTRREHTNFSCFDLKVVKYFKRNENSLVRIFALQRKLIVVIHVFPRQCNAPN